MVNVLQHLKNTDIFADLPEELLVMIGNMTRLISVQRGEFIFSEGEAASAFYIAISGYYRLIQHGDNGQEIVVEIFGKGDPIGLVAVLRRGTYPSSVEVLEDGQLLKFAVHDMDVILEQYPSVAKQMLIVVHKRLCESHQRIRDFCTGRVENCVAAALLRLVRKSGMMEQNGLIQLNLRLRRRDLAQLCGTTVETVSRILKVWQRNNIVETGRERVGIIDLDQFVSIAENRLMLC